MKNWKLWPRNFVVFRWLPVQLFLFLTVQEGLVNNMVLYVGFLTSSFITILGSTLSITTKARNATVLLNHKPSEIWNIAKTSFLKGLLKFQSQNAKGVTTSLVPRPISRLVGGLGTRLYTSALTSKPSRTRGLEQGYATTSLNQWVNNYY